MFRYNFLNRGGGEGGNCLLKRTHSTGVVPEPPRQVSSQRTEQFASEFRFQCRPTHFHRYAVDFKNIVVVAVEIGDHQPLEHADGPVLSGGRGCHRLSHAERVLECVFPPRTGSEYRRTIELYLLPCELLQSQLPPPSSPSPVDSSSSGTTWTDEPATTCE